MSVSSQLAQLPSVDQVLQTDLFIELSGQYGRQLVVNELRQQLDKTRQSLLNAESTHANDNINKQSIIDHLHKDVHSSLNGLFTPSIKKVFNLTGTILHTNLGRAPYPQSAIDAMITVSQGACNLEFDLASGQRGRRDDHVEKWICKLTGAEAATTVNNNAAAVLLTLNSLAAGKKVIVSRGELVEIGGSFRIPAIMKKADCKLREVGTTNRTHLQDYEDAISKKTAALMKVHTSNFEVNGFTKTISATELAALAKQNHIPLIDDLGSGTLTDLTAFGLPHERTAREAIKDGADIITFSGDKLLGGPQCGIIAGRRDLIKIIDKNPLKRAMRLDKVALATLEAVLKLYANPEQLAVSVPALRLLSRTAPDIKDTAVNLSTTLKTLLPKTDISVESCDSQIGSGALPTKTLESFAVVIKTTGGMSITDIAATFRSLSVPVIGRITHDALWLDCRALHHDLENLSDILKQELKH